MAVREPVLDVGQDNSIRGVTSISRKPAGDYTATWHPSGQSVESNRLRAATILRWLADSLEVDAITTTEGEVDRRLALL